MVTQADSRCSAMGAGNWLTFSRLSSRRLVGVWSHSHAVCICRLLPHVKCKGMRCDCGVGSRPNEGVGDSTPLE